MTLYSAALSTPERCFHMIMLRVRRLKRFLQTAICELVADNAPRSYSDDSHTILIGPTEKIEVTYRVQILLS